MRKIVIILTFIFVGFVASAQTQQVIERDLLTSFKKISYYSDKNDYEKTSASNDEFAKKLKEDAEKYPVTLNYPFNTLTKENLVISNSTDGNLRIYSWDTEAGGTMHFFESIFQYKAGDKTAAIIDAPGPDGDNRPNYLKIYTFKSGDKSYYLAVYLTIGSSKDIGGGIHLFNIENNKMNNVKLIKTDSGLHSELSYYYDFGSVANIAYKKRSDIHFDNTTNTIYIPLVDGKHQMTNKFILYKFTGQYFEKVKN